MKILSVKTNRTEIGICLVHFFFHLAIAPFFLGTYMIYLSLIQKNVYSIQVIGNIVFFFYQIICNRTIDQKLMETSYSISSFLIAKTPNGNRIYDVTSPKGNQIIVRVYIFLLPQFDIFVQLSRCRVRNISSIIHIVLIENQNKTVIPVVLLDSNVPFIMGLIRRRNMTSYFNY